MPKIFVPITYVDPKAKVVRGFLGAEALKNQKRSISMPELAKATTGYDGCLRAMGDRFVAAGKVVKLAADDGAVAVAAKISDYAEWEKILEHLYTAFALSIEPSDDGYDLKMVFLSDSPSDHFDLERAEQGGPLAKANVHQRHVSPLWAMREALKNPVFIGHRTGMNFGGRTTS